MSERAEAATRLLAYIRRKRARRKWARWWHGPMLDNRMIDRAFDDISYDDILSGREVWSDTSVSPSCATPLRIPAADRLLAEFDKPILDRFRREIEACDAIQSFDFRELFT